MRVKVDRRDAAVLALLQEDSSRSIAAIADLAGFGSPESMRRHFRVRGLPAPSRYRRQFG